MKKAVFRLMRSESVLLLAALLLYTAAQLSGPVRYVPARGIYLENDCATYDGWIIWDRDGWHFPNGWLGRSRYDCHAPGENGRAR